MQLGGVPATADLSELSDGAWAPGDVLGWVGTTDPTGWLILDGRQTVSRSDASGLFAKFGTTFGVGDGSTTFGIPDSRGRFPIGIRTAIPVVGDQTWQTPTAPGAASGGPLNHTHNTSFQVASHRQGPGAMIMGDHSHGNSFIMNSHTHSIFVFNDEVYDNGSETSLIVVTNATGSTAQALSGSIGGATNINNGGSGSVGNIPIAGETAHSGAVPVDGATAAAEPPYQTLNWIVKK